MDCDDGHKAWPCARPCRYRSVLRVVRADRERVARRARPDAAPRGVVPPRAGIRANALSMSSRHATVERTPASRKRSPLAAVAPRASPHVPDFVARCTDPGCAKKNAACTAAGFTLNAGKSGISAVARAMSTSAGAVARTADDAA